MALIDELLPASYKDVPFLVTGADTPGGIKHVKHTFPNSTNQTIEELGTLQKTYIVSAIITGDDYTEKRNRLLLALEEGGIGILSHPLYGIVNNLKAVEWTPVESFTNLGELHLTITFEVDTGQVVPVATQNTVSIVNQSNDDVVDALNTNIADNYSITRTFTENFQDAVNQGNEIIDAFNSNTSFLAVSADQIDLFSSEISNFGKNLTTLVQNPQALADSVLTLFATVNGLYPTVEATLTVFKKFFDFGDSDSEIPQTTVIRTERKDNRDILRATVQTAALSYSYLNASQVEFSNVVQVTETADELEEQYQKITQIDGLPDVTVSTVTDMRVEVQQFFREQRLSADQIISIRTNKTSTRLLSYQYYGSTDDASIIQDLNGITDVSYISGNLDIVTA